MVIGVTFTIIAIDQSKIRISHVNITYLYLTHALDWQFVFCYDIIITLFGIILLIFHHSIIWYLSCSLVKVYVHLENTIIIVSIVLYCLFWKWFLFWSKKKLSFLFHLIWWTIFNYFENWHLPEKRLINKNLML